MKLSEEAKLLIIPCAFVLLIIFLVSFPAKKETNPNGILIEIVEKKNDYQRATGVDLEKYESRCPACEYYNGLCNGGCHACPLRTCGGESPFATDAGGRSSHKRRRSSMIIKQGDELEAGKWYRYLGTKAGASWNHDGKMNFMLDGKPHLCIEARGITAVFVDDPMRKL